MNNYIKMHAFLYFYLYGVLHFTHFEAYYLSLLQDLHFIIIFCLTITFNTNTGFQGIVLLIEIVINYE